MVEPLTIIVFKRNPHYIWCPNLKEACIGEHKKSNKKINFILELKLIYMIRLKPSDNFTMRNNANDFKFNAQVTPQELHPVIWEQIRINNSDEFESTEDCRR